MPRVDPVASAAVVDLVVGDAARRRAAASRLNAADAWHEAFDLADRWKITALLHAGIEPGFQPPADVMMTLRGAALGKVLRTGTVIERTAGILHALDESGISAVAIKGVAVIASLGRAAAARTTSDCDIVVRECDEARTRAVLRERGYVEINAPFRRHMAEIAHSRALHNVARTLRKDDLEVDVHWRFGTKPPAALDAGRLVDRGAPVPVAAGSLRVAHAADGVLISVHHALRNSFVPAAAVRDMCDLKLWWGHPAIDLDELLADATRSGLAPSLLALWGAVLRRDPAHGIRTGYERLAASLSSSGRDEASLLERHFEQSLVDGVPAHFTVEIFAPRVFARSVAGALTRTLRRGADAAANEETAFVADAKRPLLVRIADLPRRCRRVVRELSRPRTIASYRAIARAQSRFH